MATSTAMQDYLAEAYRLSHYQDDEPVSTSALADVLGVTAPAVTRMILRLKDAGYLEHIPYQGIKLTAEGEREALASIRRHRLVERFLVDVMHFGWHEVHDAADSMGAVVSDMLVSRMDAMAGFPKRCPHGEPIPTADGFMPNVVDTPLPQVKSKQPYVLSRVHTHDAEMLEYLGELGLTPGTPFELVERAPFNGPLQLKIGDAVCHLGHELAGVLRVCLPDEFELQYA